MVKEENNGLTRMDIHNYYVLWRNSGAKYNFSINSYEFYDGNVVSKDLLDFYHYEQVKKQNRLYWYGLPWYKKMFKNRPFPLW